MDVSAIAPRLTLKRVKERTDALDDIDVVVLQRSLTDGKSYRVLLQALAQFVAVEAANYSKAQDNSAVEARLVRGVTLVRELVAKLINNRVNIKLKGYLSVVDMAISAYECHHVLSPCFEDLLLIIDAVVSLSYVRDHMTAADWTRVIRFLATAPNASKSSKIYQKQLTHTLAALAHMMACPVSTAYLQVYNHYLQIEPLIAADANPRARVNQLRLINKLAPMVVGINTEYVARLVDYGFKMLTEPLLPMESMHTQVVCFLNSPTTIDYAPISLTSNAMPQMEQVIVNLLRSVEIMAQWRWRFHHERGLEPYRYMQGLSQLVTVYFNVKHQQQKQQLFDGDSLGFGTGLLAAAASSTSAASGGGGGEVASKRARKEPLERKLAQASTAVGFCFLLMDFDNHIALQLLAFILIDDVVLGYLTEPDLTYWALQVMAHQLKRPESAKPSVALFRQILPYIKSPVPVGPMACQVFGLAVIKGIELLPNALEVTALGHQLNSIIQFADTNGPGVMLAAALEFWGFLLEAAAALSVKLSPQMSQRVLRWFAVRWLAYIGSATADDVASIWGSLEGFIGLLVRLGRTWRQLTDKDKDEYADFWKSYNDVEEIVAKHSHSALLQWRSPVVSGQIVAPEVMDMLYVVGGQPGVAFAAGLIELQLGKLLNLVVDDAKQVMAILNRVSPLLNELVLREVGLLVKFDPLAVVQSSSSRRPEAEAVFDLYMDTVGDTQETAEVPTWTEATLRSDNNTLVSAIRFIARTRPLELVPALNDIDTSVVLWALPTILENLNSENLAEFIDYFGINVLALADYRCAEVVVISAVKLVEMSTANDELNKRHKDISRWLLDLTKAGLVVTEPLLNVVITWLSAGADRDSEKVKMLATLLSLAPISTKYATASVTAELIRKLPPAAQKGIITAATIVISTDSDTEAITTLIYRGMLALGLYVAMYLALFAIMEAAVSENQRMVEYAPSALAKISQHYHHQLLAELFHLVSYDLLAWKWTTEGELKHFPFDIFGIDLGEASYLALSREMTSVVLALPRQGDTSKTELAPEAMEVLEDIAGVKQATVNSVVEASLPELIALAYTKKAKGAIFRTLKLVLQFDRDTMFELSMVIMLAILRRLDVSQEDELNDAFGIDHLPLLHDSATIIDDPLVLRIVPRTARGILDEITQKWTPPHAEYGTQPGFKRHKWVYFWLRHLCADAVAATMPDQRSLAWRRVKVTLALCHQGILRHLATIVTEAALQMIAYPEVVQDVYTVLEFVDLCQVSDVAVLLLLVRLLLTTLPTPPAPIITEVNHMVERTQLSVEPLFAAASSWLRLHHSTLTEAKVEDYLADKPSEDGVAIIAHIWTPPPPTAPKREVVRNITAMTNWPPQLETWRQQYSARYYLQGHSPPPPLSADADVVDYMLLNHVLSLLVAPPSRKFFSFRQWGFVEAAFAVLMKEYASHGYPGVLPNFATTSNALFGRYVQEMTMSAYEMVMPQVPAVVPVNDIDFEQDWIAPWMLAMLADLSHTTVVARILLPLVASLPQLARRGLVATVGYYLWQRGRAAINAVVGVLTALTDDGSPLSMEDKQVVVEVALGIRAAAKREGKSSAFAAVWQQLNLAKIVDYAIAVGQPCTAMMVAEDATDSTPDWLVFSRIYPQIDDDLIEGLPQPPTLSAILSLIVRDHNSLRRGQWLTANADALEFCGHRLLPQDSDDDYQCWRLNQWDLPPPACPTTENGVIYSVLKHVHDLQTFDVGTALKWAARVSPECMAAVEAVNVIVNEEEPPKEVGLELAIQARQVGYQLKQNLEGVILELVRLAQVATLQKLKIQATFIIDEQCREVPGLDRVAQYHDAHLVWDQGMASAAISLLEGVGLGSINVGAHAQGLNVHGLLIAAHLVEWKALLRQAHPRKLMEGLVVPQVAELAQVSDPGAWTVDMARAYRMFGAFCEAQAKSASLSEEILVAERRLKHALLELVTWKKHRQQLEGQRKPDAKRLAEARRQFDRAKHQANQFQLVVETAVFAQRQFAATAVECFMAKTSLDADDETTDRFFAGWLQALDDHDLQFRIADKVAAIPAHHLVLWTNQLVLRLDGGNSSFQRVLLLVLIQLVLRHPLHSVYQLISLLFGNPNEAKVKAGYELWKRIIAKDDGNHHLLKQIYKFCKQVVVVAMKKPRKTIDLASDADVSGWVSGELPPVPPPTMSLPVRPDEDYSEVPTMALALPKVEVAPLGLSKPKIITFVLSDGNHHKLLAKHGNDDLRQDQIMEQVFEKVNQMLTRDSQARKRNLRIRTYTVVPLGPQLGMIEFVPRGAGLIDIVRPYHRNQDSMTADEARSRMKEVQKGDRALRIAEYREICKHIKPVMRHWFRDTFVSSQAWYDSRVNWTRGVALLLMIGHILGLGDRHCNNVMIDTGSGDPIHIDLGVAFDQGKRLTVPETVPFRLTRDIVDGFGPSGVNGMFTKGCEYTLTVLRANCSHILAILDVLRWDPLYLWLVLAAKLARLQLDGKASGVVTEPKALLEDDGSEAAKAIVTVSDKLRGIPGNLSVEANVRELIHEATSDENLALIYQGWSPFY